MNEDSNQRLFITDEELIERIRALANGVEQSPSTIINRFCRYGLRNYEELLYKTADGSRDD